LPQLEVAVAAAVETAAGNVPAGAWRRFHLIDDTLASWYGPRIGPAIDALRSFFAP
jgi:hypothetical protein